MRRAAPRDVCALPRRSDARYDRRQMEGVILSIDRRHQRFGELRKLLSKVTQRTLTQHARAEADGLVARKVFAEVP